MHKQHGAALQAPRMRATPPPRASLAGQRDRAALGQTAVAHARVRGVRRGPGGAQNCAPGLLPQGNSTGKKHLAPPLQGENVFKFETNLLIKISALKL